MGMATTGLDESSSPEVSVEVSRVVEEEVDVEVDKDEEDSLLSSGVKLLGVSRGVVTQVRRAARSPILETEKCDRSRALRMTFVPVE